MGFICVKCSFRSLRDTCHWVSEYPLLCYRTDALSPTGWRGEGGECARPKPDLSSKSKCSGVHQTTFGENPRTQ